MSKIITISREFGSGGRELGKRLADAFGIPCYDHQIIDMIAEQYGYNKDYVSHLSESSITTFYPSTIGRGFASTGFIMTDSVEIAGAENKIIKELAQKGDCVIVGRSADSILSEMKPFNIFVYADNESKIKRCRDRADKNENFTDSQMLRKMKEIDKRRSTYRSMFADGKWGSKENYNLLINTSGKEIKSLIPGIVKYIECWMNQDK